LPELAKLDAVSPRVKRAVSVLLLLLSCVLCGPVEAEGATLVRSRTSDSGKTASGLPPELIQRIIRQNFGQFRLCYEAGLRSCPNLQGRVTVGFIILRDGSVKGARVVASDLADKAVATCVAQRMGELTFPSFEGKPIKVSYPIMFSPGG
jgi:hypothetical protein